MFLYSAITIVQGVCFVAKSSFHPRLVLEEMEHAYICQSLGAFQRKVGPELQADNRKQEALNHEALYNCCVYRASTFRSLNPLESSQMAPQLCPKTSQGEARWTSLLVSIHMMF